MVAVAVAVEGPPAINVVVEGPLATNHAPGGGGEGELKGKIRRDPRGIFSGDLGTWEFPMCERGWVEKVCRMSGRLVHR